MKKINILFLLTFVVLALVLVGCGANTTQRETPDEESSDIVLTLEELSKYNGEDGNPAYIAVDGVIYDVTDVGPWSGGEHNGFSAGNDLTDEIKNISPHGVSKLEGLPIVGKLAD